MKLKNSLFYEDVAHSFKTFHMRGTRDALRGYSGQSAQYLAKLVSERTIPKLLKVVLLSPFSVEVARERESHS